LLLPAAAAGIIIKLPNQAIASTSSLLLLAYGSQVSMMGHNTESRIRLKRPLHNTVV
jgi:hypothetical protein